MFETILLPITQSKETLSTIRKTIEIAKSYKSQLILLSVDQRESSISQKIAESNENLMNQAKAKIADSGINYNIVERAGKAPFIICELAAELNIDLIIIGTRGINLQKDTHSTVSQVLKIAPCPVLVVP